MHRGLATTLRWIGRILILFAPYVVMCALFLPQGIQFLNPALCPPGLELDNARYAGPHRSNDAKLELVCTGPEATQAAAAKIALVAVGSITLGLVFLYFSQRAERQRMYRPTGPPLH